MKSMAVFNWICRSRQEDILGRLNQISAEYCFAEKDAQKIFDSLKKDLPLELEAELVHLVDARINMEVTASAVLYEYGFRDGIKLLLQVLLGVA